MQLNDRDKGYLWDMLDAAKDILGFISDVHYEQFEANKMIRFAVERQLLVIGEAANHVSDEAQSGITSIPWKSIIGLRNIIAHDYGEILIANIWKVSTRNIPELINELKKFV